jgi:hypothetical protein
MAQNQSCIENGLGQGKTDHVLKQRPRLYGQTLISVYKGNWNKPRILNNKIVKYISEYFTDTIESAPLILKANSDLAYCGSVLSGEGFILNPFEANLIIEKGGDVYKDVIKKYMVGDDLNNTIGQNPTRFVIDFKNWPIETAKKYSICFEIVKEKVKPERDKVKRTVYRDKWWQFAEKGVSLYSKIKSLSNVILVARTSKTLAFVKVPSDIVFSANLTVFSTDEWYIFSLVQSNIHSAWAWKYGTTLKSDLIYAPADIVNLFPMLTISSIGNISNLESIGEKYHTYRQKLMLGIHLGLTKTYNLFHTQGLPAPEQANILLDLPPKDIEKHYGKETAAHVKHLTTYKEATYTLEQALAGIHHLRALHVEMDQAVLEAYGWGDIALRHDFYEVDYLPENDRVRYTIHPDARREVLKRLLELNHQIYAEEVAQGLHEKGKGKKKATEASNDEEERVNYPGEQGKMFEDGRQGKLF